MKPNEAPEKIYISYEVYDYGGLDFNHISVQDE